MILEFIPTALVKQQYIGTVPKIIERARKALETVHETDPSRNDAIFTMEGKLDRHGEFECWAAVDDSHIIVSENCDPSRYDYEHTDPKSI